MKDQILFSGDAKARSLAPPAPNAPFFRNLAQGNVVTLGGTGPQEARELLAPAQSSRLSVEIVSVLQNEFLPRRGVNPKRSAPGQLEQLAERVSSFS
jgi:hypothetical protein